MHLIIKFNSIKITTKESFFIKGVQAPNFIFMKLINTTTNSFQFHQNVPMVAATNQPASKRNTQLQQAAKI